MDKKHARNSIITVFGENYTTFVLIRFRLVSKIKVEKTITSNQTINTYLRCLEAIKQIIIL